MATSEAVHVELGVNLIDTADSYGPGISEELIAEALYPYPAGLVIATKGGWERPGPGQWTHNGSPKHLAQALEGSLKRLRLYRIDVHHFHAPDNAVSFEASVEALAKLREQGKIRHVALSNVTREHIERARRIVPIAAVQNRYSFADREYDFVVDYCEKNGIAFLPWAPMGQGRKAHEAIEKVARELEAAPSASSFGMASQAVPGDSADTGNFIACASWKRTSQRQALSCRRQSYDRAFRSERSAGEHARLAD
jgi:pyridoxine 4-dehydrogenase